MPGVEMEVLQAHPTAMANQDSAGAAIPDVPQADGAVVRGARQQVPVGVPAHSADI